MDNNTTVSISAIQIGFPDIRNVATFCSACSIIFYIITVLINVLVFSVIILKKLHEPMHILFCNLLLNGIIISTTLLPKLTVDILSELKTISVLGCYCQMFFMHVFVFTELMLLSVMAYDRYVAICDPLRYYEIMTHAHMNRLIATTWLFSIVPCFVGVILCARQPLCNFAVDKPYCDFYSVLKLLCTDQYFYNMYALVLTFLNIFPISIIIYSYINIIEICLQKSRKSYWKASQTCFTHLLMFIIYLIGVLFIIIQNRLPANNIPQGVHAFLSLECFILPPLANPVIYGLRTKQIRTGVEELTRFFFSS
ncbi:olfactory receptor 142-like [Protopterus annectens]|uniref:olfactory receptor 142-like n=1 Tax=Protopterus annectens TaxID=7888 RepID=UPI001CFAA430|nr:olfactory receptor 142-like [Protopterus annectens]